MNYKTLPLFAILLLMIIPASNAYATLGTSTATIDSSNFPYNIDQGVGNYLYKGTPKGLTSDANGAYLAYKVLDSNNSDSILAFSTTSDGTNWSTPLNVTTTAFGFGYAINDITTFVSNSGNTIDILWTEISGGGGTPADINHARSTNGGTSFGSVNLVHATVNGFGNQDSIWFSGSGDNLAVVFEDGADGELQFSRSTNGGTTWSSTVIVDDGLGGGILPSGNWKNVVLEQNASGTTYWVMYTATDTTNFDNDVYTQYSNDSGATFTTPINLSSAQGTEAGVVLQNHLFISGSNVTAIFNGFGGGGTPYLSQALSTNSGVSFSAQEDLDLGIDCDWTLNSLNSHYVTGDGANLASACYYSGGGATGDVRVSTTSDSGENWTSFASGSIQDDNSDSIGDQLVIKMAPNTSGQSLYVVWLAFDDNGGLGEAMNLYDTSQDGGATWTTDEIIVGSFDNSYNQPYGVTAFANDVYLTFKNQAENLVAYFESFTPPDTDDPVLTLVGSTPVTVIKDDVYSELGATCLDPTEGQIDGNVVIGGDTVDESTVAVYVVDYDCDDGSSNSAVTIQRTVNVVDDQTPPVISVTESEPITLLQDSNDSSTDFVTCIDNLDGVITFPDFDIQNGAVTNIDITDLGLQTETFECTDSASNGVLRTVDFIVKRLGTGLSSGTTTGGSSIGGTAQNILDTFADVPDLIDPRTGEPMVEQAIAQVQEEISLFESLFAGFVESFQQQSVVSDGLTSGSGVPASDAGGFTPNPIAQFFDNLFGAFFN